MITGRYVQGLIDSHLFVLAVKNPKSKRVNVELRRRHLLMKAREYQFAFAHPREWLLRCIKECGE